jgi:hypothetical protein
MLDAEAHIDERHSQKGRSAHRSVYLSCGMGRCHRHAGRPNPLEHVAQHIAVAEAAVPFALAAIGEPCLNSIKQK